MNMALKVQQAAEKNGATPQDHCDAMAPAFRIMEKT